MPSQFVLKCNNDSGGIVICKDKNKLNKKETIRFLSERLKNNGFWYGREWPYKNVKPCIIAEKYMENSDSELIDYKVHVFNGQPQFVLVCKGRYDKNGMTEDFYSCEWERLNVKRKDVENSSEIIEKPIELEIMLEYARILAKDIPFLRVDFYIVNHNVYFGELTFYPASGFKAFEPFIFDKMLGDLLEIF